MKKKEVLIIDSTSGGNGDIWMRLVGLYAMAYLYPRINIQIILPDHLIELATNTFSERLEILEKGSKKPSLIYTSLGLKDLFKGLLKGQRYIVPYHRSVIHDKKQKRFKDKINIAVFNIANFFGVIQLPSWAAITTYQAFLDTAGIAKFKKTNYSQFVDQINADYESLNLKVNKVQPSSQLVLPANLAGSRLVFPTGTGRQFVPVWWAKENLAEAYYAFFYKDSDALIFQQNGLKTILYYKPQDIVVLAAKANWSISTDSFPSHVLQSASSNCTIAITGTLKRRIVSPAFKGNIVDAEVKCHPCLHLDRSNHPVCAAGFSECLNWKNVTYSNNLLQSALLTSHS